MAPLAEEATVAAGRSRHWRDPAKELFWRQAIVKRQRGGLAVRDFCAIEGLLEASFYHWRRELVRRAGQAATARHKPASRRLTSGRRASERAVPSGEHRNGRRAFAPVQVVADEISGRRSAPTLELHLPSGVRLCVPT